MTRVEFGGMSVVVSAEEARAALADVEAMLDSDCYQSLVTTG